MKIEKMRNASGQEQGSKLTFHCACKVLLVRHFSTSKLVRPLTNSFPLKLRISDIKIRTAQSISCNELKSLIKKGIK